ncbi:fluoride efflux transporter FluC [Nesterenkonia ebinurensis]|uniref:fluoride efflux transporter FluC n=1 Tax=Nesterenkonia ebinurensis TaxID=2608252 RepID=UPI00168B6270|nr:CrcB family protein [Nesterenkonia ebinurensis]
MPTTEENAAQRSSPSFGPSLPVLVLWVAAAGACGAVLRLLLVELSDEQYMRFPWVTLVINLAGSGALGTLVGATHAWQRLPQWTVPVLGTGFLGSFTTFSAVILAGAAAQQRDLFAQVTSTLVVPPEMWEVGAYLVISMLFCTAAAAAGITLGRAVFGCTAMDCQHTGGDHR